MASYELKRHASILTETLKSSTGKQQEMLFAYNEMLDLIIRIQELPYNTIQDHAVSGTFYEANKAFVDSNVAMDSLLKSCHSMVKIMSEFINGQEKQKQIQGKEANQNQQTNPNALH